MEFLFGLIFQAVGEIVIQVLFEVLFEFGFHELSGRRGPPQPLHPLVAIVFYSAIGAIAGGLSLIAFPEMLISSQIGRNVNLLFTPLAVGLSMSLVGSWRRRRGDNVMRIDRFAYGYLFALVMAVVRFLYGS